MPLCSTAVFSCDQPLLLEESLSITGKTALRDGQCLMTCILDIQEGNRMIFQIVYFFVRKNHARMSSISQMTGARHIPHPRDTGWRCEDFTLALCSAFIFPPSPLMCFVGSPSTRPVRLRDRSLPIVSRMFDFFLWYYRRKIDVCKIKLCIILWILCGKTMGLQNTKIPCSALSMP